MKVENNETSKKKHAAKQKRACKGDQKEEEKRIIEKGLERLCDVEHSEYKKCKKNCSLSKAFNL